MMQYLFVCVCVCGGGGREENKCREVTWIGVKLIYFMKPGKLSYYTNTIVAMIFIYRHVLQHIFML